MPAVSDEELKQLHEDNEALRQRLADAQSGKAQNEADANRDYEASQLMLENARLEAAVASAEAQADPEVTSAGVTVLAESSQSQLEAAIAQLEHPQGVPVDVNDPANLAKYDPKDTNPDYTGGDTVPPVEQPGESVVASDVVTPAVAPAAVPASGTVTTPATSPQTTPPGDKAADKAADKQNGGNS
jgi:hypothetical protein